MSNRMSSLTVDDALQNLQLAFQNVYKHSYSSCCGKEWKALETALSPFKDPIDGGAFSVHLLEDSFSVLLQSGVLKHVYVLHNNTKLTKWNVKAIDTSSNVWARIKDIIACSNEVREECRIAYGGSPTAMSQPSPTPGRMR